MITNTPKQRNPPNNPHEKPKIEGKVMMAPPSQPSPLKEKVLGGY